MQEVEKQHPVEQEVKHRVSWHVVLALIAMVVMVIFLPFNPGARAYLTTRSITTGSSLPGITTTHDFKFSALAAPSIGSVMFEYCVNSALPNVPCVAPTGLNVSPAVLQFQSGDTGYSIHSLTTSSQNKIIITRSAAASSTGEKVYRFANITNPTDTQTTYYVRIFTYASTDGSGIYNDTGSVAFSIQNVLSVSLYVPPYLALCSGVTVEIDCASTAGSVVDMGELSKTTANSTTTQFAVATNSYNGYSAMLVGSTMTAGNRIIPALLSNSISRPGESQFGVNLISNTSPNVGRNVEGNGSGLAANGYNQANIFKFNSGDVVASSALSTEWNRYTISYLVNVADGQPAGRYATTLTVIATTTF